MHGHPELGLERMNGDVAHAHRPLHYGSHSPCHGMAQQEGHADPPHEPEPCDRSPDGYTEPTHGSAHW